MNPDLVDLAVLTELFTVMTMARKSFRPSFTMWILQENQKLREISALLILTVCYVIETVETQINRLTAPVVQKLYT